jgi:chaperone modulatory protein CbpM
MNIDKLTLIHTGSILEEDSLSLEQLCCTCGVQPDWVARLVEESIIEPDGKEMPSWRFSGLSLVRVRSALNLERDLGVNLAGVALVLDLLEELAQLRRQLVLNRKSSI